LLQQQGFGSQNWLFAAKNYYAAKIIRLAQSDYLLTMPRRFATPKIAN